MTYQLITANRNYSSWSLRPWLLMKALAIPFDDRFEPFLEAVNYAQFRKFSPTGQVPALIDGPTTIWDSLAIALYLADRHAGIWPEAPGPRAFAQAAVAEMHSGFATLRNACTMNIAVRVKPRAMSPALAKDVDRLRELFETGLARFGGPWLAGERFSVVDAFYAPVAYRIRTYGMAVGGGQAWVDHVLAHPAMRAWEAAALAETWREAAHEAELAACGEIIADFRATA